MISFFHVGRMPSVGLLLLLVVLGCSQGSDGFSPTPFPDGDTSTPDDEDGDNEEDFDQEDSTGDELDLTLALSQTQTRAGVLNEDKEVPSGENICAAIGDYKIYNNMISLVVSAVGHRCGVGAGGGNLIDAFTVQGGSDGLLEWLPAVNKRHGFVAQEVRVSNDGTNGEPAKIVVRGRAASVSLLDVALGGLAEPPLWDLETVFTLYPNSDFVFIETVAGNLSEESELVRLGDFVHVAPTMRALYQGQGFTERGPVTATNEETTPQAVWTKADLSYLLIGRQEETLLNTPLPIRLSCVGQEEDYFVSPGGTARFERVLFLHDGSWASAQTRLNDYRKTFSSAGTRQAAELAIAIGFQPRMETENVTLWLTQKTESDTFKIVSQSFGISGETTVIKMETTGSLSAFADHATLGIGTAAGVNVRLDRENRVTANLPIGAIVEISALDPLVQLDGSVVGMPVMANFFTLGSLVPEWVIPVPVTGAVLHLPLPENSGQREFRLVVAHGPVYIPDRQTIQLPFKPSGLNELAHGASRFQTRNDGRSFLLGLWLRLG